MTLSCLKHFNGSHCFHTSTQSSSCHDPRLPPQPHVSACPLSCKHTKVLAFIHTGQAPLHPHHLLLDFCWAFYLGNTLPHQAYPAHPRKCHLDSTSQEPSLGPALCSLAPSAAFTVAGYFQVTCLLACLSSWFLSSWREKSVSIMRSCLVSYVRTWFLALEEPGFGSQLYDS